MNKKKIIAIIIFVLLGLVMFTFANPRERELDSPNPNPNPIEEPKNDEDDETPEEPGPSIISRVDTVPVIEVTPTRVLIFLGDDYDVMTGVNVIDDHDTLVADANIVDTKDLNVGRYEIIYTVRDSRGNRATANRELIVLDPDGDEDGDKFTNKEEYDNDTDLEDENSYPILGKPIFDDFDQNITVDQKETYDDVLPTAKDTLGKAVIVTAVGTVDSEVVDVYTITYTATDRSGNTEVATRTVTVIDKEKPVITLNGDSEIRLLVGHEYIEQGAKVTDNVDDETVALITGSVDTALAGEYTLKYNYIDKAGNDAIEQERIVKVYDPDGDEDGDKFTNKEEYDNDTDLEDENSYPILGKPVFDDFDQNITVNQSESYTDVLPTAKDTLGKEVVVTSSGTVDIEVVDEYTITYTATDRSGNTESATRTIKVVDNVDPIITLKGDSIITLVREYNIPWKFWEAGYIVNYSEAGYNVVEKNTYTVTTSITFKEPYSTIEEVVTSIKPNVGKYTITYTVVDASGNSGSVSRTVYVIRAIDEAKDIELTVGKTTFDVCTTEPCNQLTSDDYQVVAKDWFDGKWFDYHRIENIIIENNADITKVGSYNVRFTATDWRGQQKSIVKTIKIVDNVKPEIIGLSETEKVSVTVRGININIPKILATDNYYNDTDLVVSYTFKGEYDFRGSLLGSKHTDVYLKTIIYTVKDGSGNKSTYTYNLGSRQYLKKINGWENLGLISSWQE